MAEKRSLETLTAADFREFVGSRFRVGDVAGEGGLPDSFEVELVEVEELPGVKGGAFREPFSMVFRGPAEPVAPQRIYRLAAERFGEVEVFMVPLGPEAGAMRYEVVFS